MPKPEESVEEFFTQLLQRINDLEERTKNSREKIDLISSSLHQRNKKISEEIYSIKERLERLNEEIEKIKQKIDYILAEMPSLVRKEDLMIVEKFIKMWEPLKFVTKEDVERMIEKKIKK
jgi:predicted  nucleic acid-binding Zn-ribbon protein